MAKKDNSTILSKTSLRRKLRREIEDPIVLETHGGYGELFNKVYADVPQGVVFETKPEKTDHLCEQRPTWAVYEVDCLKALQAGVGFHIPINFVDVDPYGDPWPVISAVLDNAQSLPDRWGLVVNDGLRRFLMLGRGWKSRSVDAWVQKIGNEQVAKQYPDICYELLREKAAGVGFDIDLWACNSCGHGGQMTHYAAVLVRK